jgi:hypothetical protein
VSRDDRGAASVVDTQCGEVGPRGLGLWSATVKGKILRSCNVAVVYQWSVSVGDEKCKKQNKIRNKNKKTEKEKNTINHC